MNTLTIPKKLAGRDDLIIISRKEYEKLLELKKVVEFKPTASQKKALVRAEKNFSRGKSLTLNELVKKLGFKN